MKNPKRIIASLLIVPSLLTFAGCRFQKDLIVEEPTPGVSETGLIPEQTAATAETVSIPLVTAVPTETAAPATTAPPVSAPTTAAPTAQPTAAPTAAVPTAPTTALPTAPPTTAAPTTAAQPNYAAYTAEQTVKLLSDAVNKTKAYRGNITVHHKESFTGGLKSVQPGGALVQRAVDFVIGLVVKPTEEDYQFANGVATTSEGEQTQLLLPKAAPFTLTAAGVQSAVARAENGGVRVQLTLKPEVCTALDQIPPNNAAAIGYLNLAGRFSVLKINSVKIQYPGSTIDALIRPDGYVQSVTYTIKMDATAEATGMGISGSGNFAGDQTEVWEIRW